MIAKSCQNCGRSIENLEESCLHKGNVVCKECKSKLEEERDVLEHMELTDQSEILTPQGQQEVGMSPMTEFFSYDGRINRAKYLLSISIIGIVGLVAISFWQSYSPETSILGNVILAVVSSFPVVKRWHDIDKSGANYFWGLVPIANIIAGVILLFRKGTQGPNKYGADPLMLQGGVLVHSQESLQEQNGGAERSHGHTEKLNTPATSTAYSSQQSDDNKQSDTTENATVTETEREHKRKRHRFLKVELAVLACVICIWVVKSVTTDIDSAKGEYDQATSYYREITGRNPTGEYAQYMLGWWYCYGEGVPQDYNKAAEWYSKAAQQGHAEAQCGLGLLYEFGNGVPQDYNKAAEWYSKAAQQGYAEAQHRLAWLYYNDKEVVQDYTKAAEWIRKAAEQGYAPAQYNLGVLYDNGQGMPQDYTKAAECYRKAADQGYAEAQYRLAWLYYNGKGVAQDYKKAAEWYTKAAQQGKARARFNLGLMYYRGEGVAQDYKKAAEWFRKAAQQGEQRSQYNLSLSYFIGQGVIEDYVQAYKWILLAGKNGFDYSKVSDLKADLRKVMTPAQIAQAQQLAKKFAAKSKTEISSER